MDGKTALRGSGSCWVLQCARTPSLQAHTKVCLIVITSDSTIFEICQSNLCGTHGRLPALANTEFM